MVEGAKKRVAITEFAMGRSAVSHDAGYGLRGSLMRARGFPTRRKSPNGGREGAIIAVISR